MKSYFLDRLDDEGSARAALSRALPNWVDPWLLKDSEVDVIAYMNVQQSSVSGVCIQADVSGRHFDDDEIVIGVLKSLKELLGGVIIDDDETVIG